MNLYAKLLERENQGKPVRVGLIGAGKFAAMYLAQVPRTPGVRGTCARYIEPNLPAPMRPMRTGLPSAARCWSLAYRLMLRLPFSARSCR